MTDEEILLQILEQLKATNAKLDRANDLLETLVSQAGLFH